MGFFKKLGKFFSPPEMPKPDTTPAAVKLGLKADADFNDLRGAAEQLGEEGAALLQYERPAALIQSSEEPVQSGSSHLGGAPSLPENLPWPVTAGDDPRPLSFVAQINLAEAAAALGEICPLSEGMLFFFYDNDEQPWGFDPDEAGRAAVLFAPQAGTPDFSNTPAFQEKAVTFAPSADLPHSCSSSVRANFDLSAQRKLELLFKAYDDLRVLHGGGSKLFGWHDPVQDDIQIECELVNDGYDCGGDSWKHSVPRYEKAACEWVLLAQFESDSDLGMEWGDCGRLYFSIRESDLQKRDFSRIWFTLQCD